MNGLISSKLVPEIAQQQQQIKPALEIDDVIRNEMVANIGNRLKVL